MTYAKQFCILMSGKNYELSAIPEHLAPFVIALTPSTRVFVLDGVARRYPASVRFSDMSYACPDQRGNYVPYTYRNGGFWRDA